MVLSVRPRTDADLPACVEVLRAVHSSDAYPMRWPEDPADWITPPGLTAAWVAERKSRIVGHVCVVGVTVSRLFADPVARGLGCGAVLLEAAQSHAAREGLSLVLDVVDDGGAAVALYERLGWRLVERRLADWSAPDGRRPVVRIYAAPV